MAKYKKSLTNPSLYRQFSNNSSEMFDYTMSNIMDGFYDGAMNSAIDGKFKAVCLSGIKTEDNTGEGTDANDAVKSGEFINLIIRPLTNFGNIIPDPRSSKDPEEINRIISLHASTFLARSDYEFDVASPISFGQVIDCYFEKGSISNSDFKTLRFSEPKGKLIETSFSALGTIEGVQTGMGADWTSSFLLGSDVDSAAATEQGKTSNIKGSRTADKLKYIVLHYSAAGGGKKAVLSYENRATEYAYHYMIDRDGSFYNTADPEALIWHAGGNRTVKNTNSIGVCIMNIGYERDGVPAKTDWFSGKQPNGSKTLKWEPYTDASINKCAEICAELCKKYNIPVANIVGHSDIQSNKSDPGPAFGLISFRIKVQKSINT